MTSVESEISEESDKLEDNLAVTCNVQQCDILTSEDSDEPVQLPFKLRNSKLCSVSSLRVI